MNKKLKTVVAASVVIIVATLMVLLLVHNKKAASRPYRKYVFPSTVSVRNHSSYSRADTVIMVLATKVFSFDTLSIRLYDIPEITERQSSMELFAMVQQLPFEEHSYILFLRPGMDDEKMKLSLSHEFVHICQYERGELIMYGSYAIWNDIVIRLSDVPYMERPFEIEAFLQQRSVKKRLNRVLYK